MKSYLSQTRTRWLKPSLLSLSLISILVGGFQFLNASTEVAARLPVLTTQKRSVSRPIVSTRLPAQVKTGVMRVHSRRMDVPMGKLKILSFSQETWPDTCFGLGRPEESCGAMLVNGWRVEVGDGSSSQFYRTDSTGGSIRHEDMNYLGSLPQGVGQKVLEFAAKELGIPANQLKVVDGKAQLWDGCLGVAGPEDACTMIGIPGWQAIVTGPQQYAVYHLNQNATMIKRNPTTSGRGSIIPAFWQPDPGMAVGDREEIVFQSITSGGIAGQVYKTVLRRNGQVLRLDMRSQPSTAPTFVRQLSPQQVQAFVQLLQQNEFGDFLGFNYAASTGADYFTIALMTPDGSQGVQYVDMVQDQTPVNLQRIIQAWTVITSSR